MICTSDAGGHSSAFADQFMAGLPGRTTGVLDISSTKSFAVLNLRSMVNERRDFLMTTFPVADANAAAPWPVFPQVADGGGYTTEFILISPTRGTGTVLKFYTGDGSAWGMIMK